MLIHADMGNPRLFAADITFQLGKQDVLHEATVTEMFRQLLACLTFLEGSDECLILCTREERKTDNHNLRLLVFSLLLVDYSCEIK